jgi:hypothetical protein
MTQTHMDLYQLEIYCGNSPITVEFLELNQTKYDYLEGHIIMLILLNPNLTIQVLEWLLSKYLDFILNNCLESDISFVWNFPMEKFIIVIDHIIKAKGNLSVKTCTSDRTISHALFMNDTFDAHMLNYLYQKDSQLDIICEDVYQISPLYYAIVFSSRLLELLQVIKSYEPSHSRTKIRTEYTDMYNRVNLKEAINKYAGNSNQSTICALIGLCGELFALIWPKYLTQDISDQFYSSKYFQCNSDQDPLIKLIPEQFQLNLRDVNL